MFVIAQQAADSILTEEIVQEYERLVPLAAGQVACLRRGDLSGFEELLEQKEKLIDRVRARIDGGADAANPAGIDERERVRDARLAGRAETAIRSVLASEEQSLAILLLARDQVSGELSGLARADAGLRGYGGAAAATRAYDRRG